MLEAKFQTGYLLRTVLENSKDLFDDVALIANPSGITLQAMDSAHVSVFLTRIPAESLLEFQCERSVNLAFSSTNLSAILRSVERPTASHMNPLTLHYNQTDDPGILHFHVEHNEHKSSDYSIKLIAETADLVTIPRHNYKAMLRIPSSYLAKVCKDFGHFGETMSIEVAGGGAAAAYVEFRGQGDMGIGAQRFGATNTDVSAAQRSVPILEALKSEEDADEGPEEVKVKLEDEDNANLQPDAALPAGEVSIVVQEPISLMFALKYVSAFAKAGRYSPTVTMRLSKDSPCTLEFELPGESGHVQYFLAPKVAEEED
eukprot:PhM_4_TR2146/c0_g1_i1/m.60485/K04802/PCNA; proliferating cell nuclear antigen